MEAVSSMKPLAIYGLIGALAMIALTTARAQSGATTHAMRTPDGHAIRTPDGRFGTACYGAPTEEVCQASFYRLIARPDAYDGRVILVIGYLIYVFGEPTLFANRESYDSGVDVEGIRIFGDLPPKIDHQAQTGVWPVAVIGTFDAKEMGAAIPKLGAITVKRIFSPLRVHGARANGPGGP